MGDCGAVLVQFGHGYFYFVDYGKMAADFPVFRTEDEGDVFFWLENAVVRID